MSSDLTRLEEKSHVQFFRSFHVEGLKGGMNRLLLRSVPTASHPTRVEVLFQFVQYMDMPMRFHGLAIHDATDETRNRFFELHESYPDCQVFRFESGGQTVGQVFAAFCMYGEDSKGAGDESMFGAFR